MNVLMTQDAVRASKIGGQKEPDDNQKNEKAIETGKVLATNENNNDKAERPKEQADMNAGLAQKQLKDTAEVNKLLKKQLESRDIIIKKQISEIHRLQGENKVLSQEQNKMQKAYESLRKEYEAEKWLGERLKNDVRDLQIQLDFQDCYLQEQSHQSSLVGNLLNEVQKMNEAQENEIIQLRAQIKSGKGIIDNQIADLQKMLGIQRKLEK